MPLPALIRDQDGNPERPAVPRARGASVQRAIFGSPRDVGDSARVTGKSEIMLIRF
jgi:hypothetical protein